MAEDRREITITAKICRRTWYEFVTQCRAHRVRVAAGVEEALRGTLERAGVPDETNPSEEQ